MTEQDLSRFVAQCGLTGEGLPDWCRPFSVPLRDCVAAITSGVPDSPALRTFLTILADAQSRLISDIPIPGLHLGSRPERPAADPDPAEAEIIGRHAALLKDAVESDQRTIGSDAAEKAAQRKDER